MRKTKRVLNSLAGVGDAATRCCDAVMTVGPQQPRELADHPPGQLGSLQRQPAIELHKAGANILAQQLGTTDEIGYLIIDMNKEASEQAIKQIKMLDENVKTRVLF